MRFASDAKSWKIIKQCVDLQQQNNELENTFDMTSTNETMEKGHLNECVDIRENWLSELFQDQSDNEIIKEDVYYELSIEKKNMLLSDFRQCSVSSNISQTSLKALFSIVNEYWPNTLRKDPRTLLETPTGWEQSSVKVGCGRSVSFERF